MTRHPLVALVAVLAFTLVAGACSDTEQVGSKENLAFDEQEANRLGEGSPTTEAPATTAAPTTAAPTTAKPATTAPPQTAPPKQAPSFTIEIVASGQGFDPFAFSVTKGTKLIVKNTDSQPRTFTSDDDGVFDSGPIPPGGSFTYMADRVGKFNFHDETRPFAVGQMEVTP